MNKNHFLLPYYGNKRKEVINIYDVIKDDIENFKYIIEPFCGTSALSYYIWLNNKDKDITYILNDNNKLLIELYKTVKDENKFLKLYEDLIELQRKTTTKEQYNEIVKKAKNEDFISWIYVNKIYNIRPMLYPSSKIFTENSWKVFLEAPIIDFIRNAKIILSNKDAIEVYEEYKGNKKAFIFLDPPYLSSENSWYKSPDVKIFEYLFENDINKEKAYILLCLENIWIIKLLFKNKKFITYNKTYETNKKKTEHIIIINKNSLKK